MCYNDRRKNFVPFFVLFFEYIFYCVNPTNACVLKNKLSRSMYLRSAKREIPILIFRLADDLANEIFISVSDFIPIFKFLTFAIRTGAIKVEYFNVQLLFIISLYDLNYYMELLVYIILLK